MSLKKQKRNNSIKVNSLIKIGSETSFGALLYDTGRLTINRNICVIGFSSFCSQLYMFSIKPDPQKKRKQYFTFMLWMFSERQSLSFYVHLTEVSESCGT